MAVGTNGYAAKSADAIGALAAGLVVNGEWTDPDLDEGAVQALIVAGASGEPAGVQPGRPKTWWNLA